MSMVWQDLAFLHWQVPPESLSARIPDGLELDLYDGQAWLGVVPFRMSGVRPRFCPSVPGLSNFPELNVRTYVTANGRPGVWFFSLDAHNWFAVRAARRLFHLPYFDAAIGCARTGDEVTYRSRRTHRGEVPAVFEARYSPTGSAFRTKQGDLDHWLTERYCLYSASPAGRIYRGDVHHKPWPLRNGRVGGNGEELDPNALLAADGLAPVAGPPLVHFVDRIDVRAWRIEPASDLSSAGRRS